MTLETPDHDGAASGPKPGASKAGAGSHALATARASRIEIEDVSVHLGSGDARTEAIRRIDLTIHPRELVCLLGPSGCGKSTLLGGIAGFVTPSRGRILVDGVPVTSPDVERGMVFQHHTLFPWKTVLDNVAFGLKMRGVGQAERTRKAREMLALVGLSGLENRYPAELSGGMQHRVEIARVLIHGPRVILMDEPFSALDAQTRLAMQLLLLDIWAEVKTTIVFVTHDIDEAIFLADRIVVLSSQPGEVRLEQRIDFERPRTVDVMTSTAFVDIKRTCLDLLRAEGIKSLRPRTAP